MCVAGSGTRKGLAKCVQRSGRGKVPLIFLQVLTMYYVQGTVLGSKNTEYRSEEDTVPALGDLTLGKTGNK